MSGDAGGGSRRILTLEEAAALPVLGGHVTVKMLRTAIAKGLLPAERLGRRIFLTEDGIDEWRRRSSVAPAEGRAASRPAWSASVSSPKPRDPDDPADPTSIALAAARAAIARLREMPDRSLPSAPRGRRGRESS